MIEDVVHEESGQFGLCLDIELNIFAIIILPHLKVLFWVFSFEPAFQSMKLLLRWYFTSISIYQSDVGCHENSQHKASIELEFLLVGHLAEELSEGSVMKECS